MSVYPPNESPANRLHRIAREMRESAELDMILRDREKGLAQTAAQVAHKIYASDLTMSEYLQKRVCEWYRNWDKHGFSITEFMGMTADEYADWVINDVVSDRVARLQLRWYMSYVLGRYRL